ncbi:MAG: cell division protein ZapD [Sedimenticolaceae bacterium]|uniref:cell division protein ZapD n=1 Tax=Candidatus Vondammii sp. HM_W22 TaxID=2687299 RepID=UPI002E7AB104|nr:cell division protein ZapD [Candidatus Vondammii sp. HM_W22]
MNGQIGQSLRENEFLKGIMQRNSMPSGSCAFDLPLHHHWLQQPHELRNSEFQTGIDTQEPLQSAITLLLSLTLGSTTSSEVARNGFFSTRWTHRHRPS